MVPAPAAAGSPANLLETQILRCHKSPPKSETLGWGLAICALTNLADDSDMNSTVRTVTLNFWTYEFPA